MQITPNDFKFSQLSQRKETNRIIVHHTASSPSTTMEQIHQWHLNKGWSGIGYHYVICSDGRIIAGRPQWAVGAHAEGSNGDSLGIVLTGNFEVQAPSNEQISSLALLIKYLRESYEKDLKVLRHRDVMATSCPGKLFPWDRLQQELRSDPDTVKIKVAGQTLEGKIIQDRTFAPVRAIAEALGRVVEWDEATRTVVIK